MNIFIDENIYKPDRALNRTDFLPTIKPPGYWLYRRFYRWLFIYTNITDYTVKKISI